MVILTLNCGSSSAKYQVYDWDDKKVMANGVVERIGIEGSCITHNVKGKKIEITSACPTHKEAIELIIKEITDSEVGVIKSMDEIGAVGHRVLHGGEKFTKSVLITPEVLDGFRDVIDLGPLHMPANIMGIEAAQKVMPNVPHAAIMDTAWHQTMPPETFRYAIPKEWYEKYAARRYGFHGTSFLYTAKRAAVLLGKEPKDTNLIICHIGNGASMCAVKNGVCYDTSMGITPLEGLVMGTRSGDLDPALPFYIMRKTGMTAEEMDNALNKKCGCLGITGRFSDRRDIEAAAEKGDKDCQLCIEMESLRIKKYIGQYMAELGHVDAIVWTAGVGERAPVIREKACSGLENWGIKIDEQRNKWSSTNNAETYIHADDSDVKIFVIPTDEELVMTEDAFALMKGTYDVHTKFKYSFQDKNYLNKAREEGLQEDLVKRPNIAKVLANKR
ncbi:acetate kinase [Treponema sp. Marseille-Q3903]|uniref:acetate kinase n=1 Tax=Treponema sp. Marseille-Q3903 TaxID=2766703 RepID=UPI00165279AD|nr:acetate kinase [Treponema sp. Marseille-Q3903]MBC6713144.1 acetate kinase [Treponema sp. Marseille-Q3903]